MLRAGHQPMVYSSRLGELAEELSAEGVPVFGTLEEIEEAPDLIHGSHYLETLDALRYFPSTPGLFVCHDRMAWHDKPPHHPMLRLYVAVDYNCRERLAETNWIEPDMIEVVGNSVDTSRFRPRDPLPEKPRKALVFSNNAGPGTYLEAVREACQQEKIQLDTVGAGVDSEIRAPEQILPEYDLVFAKARCALEAMAVGAAVVLCDTRGLGPMVKSSNVEELRRWNFGMKVLAHPLVPSEITARIREYEPSDVQRVRDYIRESATLEDTLTKWCSIYDRVRCSSSSSNPVAAPKYRPTRPLRCRDQFLMTLRLRSKAIRVRAGEEFFISVRLRRGTWKPVSTESPWPVLISYRWYNKEGGKLVQREGVRNMIAPPVPWVLGRDYNTRIVAPNQQGSYRLRVTLVQERWRWLDDKPPEVYDEMSVRVDRDTGGFYTRG
jgi:hypothetical protein